MFPKSQKKRTSVPLFPAVPIIVAVSFSLTLQAFAQGGSGATTANKSAATAKPTSGATTAASSKAATPSKATIYEGDVKTGAGGAKDKDAKADTTGKKKKKAKEIEIVKTKVVELTKATTKDWQTFPSYIELKPGQETLPLTLTVDNGPDDSTPMTAIRGDLAGRRLFTEKNFAGKKTLKIDMSNALAPGATQIVFSTFGAKGSKFSWKVTSNATPNITKIDGQSITPDKTAKAIGTLLPGETNLYTVKVGGVSSTVTSVSSDNKSVEFRVPKDLKANEKGEVTVEFTIAGAKIKPLTIKVTSPPEIASFDWIAVNPSLRKPLTITGKNFSKKPQENKVTFNGLPGEILSSSETSLTVMVPLTDNMPAPQTVSVEVNGLKANKNGTIMFDMRDTPNENGASPFEIDGAWR